jgi:hypothetical protein
MGIEFIYDKQSLLREAENKLRKQQEIRRTANRDALASNEINDCLLEASKILSTEMKPDYRICEVDVKTSGNSLTIGNYTIDNTPLSKVIKLDSKFYLYLISLKYDSEKIMNTLNGDYVIYHFQHILGREALFAMGREVHKKHCELYSNYVFKRHPIKMRKESYETINPDDNCGEDNYWDPKIVTSLIDCFKGDRMGIKVTQSGCFSPLQTILGVMVGNKI